MDGKNLKKYCLFLAIIIAIGFFANTLSKRIKTRREKNRISKSLNQKSDWQIIQENIYTEINDTEINSTKISQNKNPKASVNNNNNNNNNNETWLTVFVHGIISIMPTFSCKTINHIKHDDLENTVYFEYVKNARQNIFFCENEPKQEVGLKIIDKENKSNKNSCAAIAKIFDYQSQSTKNYYYTFGWSGLMSNKYRYKNAKNFYLEFAKEIKKFHDQGIYPKVRWIGFSHGGSLCLFVSKVIKEEKLQQVFNVDELILLGTPILEETRKLINEPLFKKIYNFYSGSDRVQILDFSQESKHFSRKKICAVGDFVPNDNLLQVKLEIFRPVKTKNGVVSREYKYAKSPTRHSVGIRKNSPGHCEWWFLQYTNNFYRDTFALNPLPVVAFIPTIISNLNNSEFETNATKTFGHQVDVKLRPFEYSMVIESENNRTKLDFLSKEKFNLFENTIYDLNFEKISKDRYKSEVRKELNKAKQTIGEYTKIKEQEKKQAKK